MLTKFQKERLADYFTAAELIELVAPDKIDDVIEVFEPEIEEALDDLNELMGIHDE